MRVEVWFDCFAHPKRGSDARGLVCVFLCTFTPWLMYVVPSSP